MASISSVGLGSGLDVKSIVSQLVALEKQPITALQTKEASIQTKISSFAQIKGLVSTFADAASKLTLDSGFNSMTVASSNASAVNATVSGVATPGNYAFSVSQLAQSQTSASGVVAAGTTMGLGSITLQVGSAAAVTVNIVDGDDTSLSGIAAKINDAGAGVTASVVTDSSGQRLVMRSNSTGAANAFTVSTSGSGPLGSLAFTTKQAAQDTLAQINGVDVTSSDRTFSQAVPGLTFTASQVTTTAADVTVTADTATTKKNIQAFVDAYNAINDLLSTQTKYDSDNKTAGDLQGDSTAVGIQNTLRSMIGSVTASGGAYNRLSDIGISVLRGGNLSVDDTKLSKALSTRDSAADVKKLFATKDAGEASNGIAVKFKALTSAMLSFDGTLNAKTDALNAEDKRNLSEQDKVTARATALEARLNAQYSALDTRMASLNSLSAYVSQQVTNWNKSSS
ncbi:flagellar filament capping protein FliD [Xylophilus sp. GOD-11R]|uniref:flagellar filament capping protein FliD n=1 Tax=Xylophilus sp. GOD-11R TaxID=3089814 RepID=UPI00298D360B|nr:flagellar filament capping protein FliD [Xylophilus sp. GOD-11R]WPB57772.1 flagellar filament capping protein FliD [Xylophilus sp. GOD-11R]